MNYPKLKLALFFFLMILSFGTVGYHFVEGMGFFESFYMTIITIGTVGFSEIKQFSEAGRVITIIVIVTGIGAGTYTLDQLTKVLLEGELRIILGRRKLERNIAKLKNHRVICGFGRIGKIICDELAEDGIKFVAIKKPTGKMIFNPGPSEKLEAADVIVVVGKKDDVKRLNQVLLNAEC